MSMFPAPPFEHRYFVVKVADAENYLSPLEFKMLREIENKVQASRNEHERPELSAIVIEKDWPEYENAAAELRKRINSETDA